MIRLCLAAMLALGAGAAAAQPLSGPAASLQGNVDSAAQRQALRDLSVCLVRQRPNWARQTLAQPYLSPAQARLSSQALSGRDNCLPGSGDAEVTFRTSSLVGSLAEHYVQTEIGQVDFGRLASALNTLSPLNVSEDFALCIAARNPGAARDLALSPFGSAAEAEAAARLARGLDLCTSPGEELTVDLQSLRALASTALYRGLTALRATN